MMEFTEEELKAMSLEELQEAIMKVRANRRLKPEKKKPASKKATPKKKQIVEIPTITDDEAKDLFGDL